MMFIIRYVTPKQVARHFIAEGSHKAPIVPELVTPPLPSQMLKLAKHLSGRYARHDFHHTSRRQPPRCFKEVAAVRLGRGYHRHQGFQDLSAAGARELTDQAVGQSLNPLGNNVRRKNSELRSLFHEREQKLTIMLSRSFLTNGE